jgi:hypothetical protein
MKDKMDKNFYIPAALFDRNRFQPCCGLSENAFKLVILRWAIDGNTILKNLFVVAQKCLNMNKELFLAAIDELKKRQIIKLYQDGSIEWRDYNLVTCPDTEDHRPKPNDKSWLISRLESPEMIEAPTSFVSSNGPDEDNCGTGLLGSLSIDQIYVYMNLMRERCEALLGINSTFIRYETPKSGKSVDTARTYEQYLRVDYSKKGRFNFHRKLLERIGKNKNHLIEIIKSLVELGLFQWQPWLAEIINEYERAKSGKIIIGKGKRIKVGVKPEFLVDSGCKGFPDKEVIRYLSKYEGISYKPKKRIKYQPVLLLRCFLQEPSSSDGFRWGWSFFSQQIPIWQRTMEERRERQYKWISQNLHTR